MSYCGYGGYVWKIVWKQGKITVAPAPERCDTVPFQEEKFKAGFDGFWESLASGYKKAIYNHIVLGTGNYRLVLYKYNISFLEKGKKAKKIELTDSKWTLENERVYASCWEILGTPLRGMYIAERSPEEIVAYFAIGGYGFGSGELSSALFLGIVEAVLSKSKLGYKFHLTMAKIQEKLFKFKHKLVYKMGTYLLTKALRKLKSYNSTSEVPLDSFLTINRLVPFDHKIGIYDEGLALKNKLKRMKYRFLFSLWSYITGLNSIRKRAIERAGFFGNAY